MLVESTCECEVIKLCQSIMIMKILVVRVGGPNAEKTNVKMLLGKLLTIHFQTWDPEEKWREISWERTYFWSVVCYH